MMPISGTLPKDKILVGSKQLKKAVSAGRAREVVLAENADPGLLEPIKALCSEHSVPITWMQSMAQLGKACGIEVGAAAAAILR